ncbi:unnamed protein product, partial [Pelagomonas calceolata]
GQAADDEEGRQAEADGRVEVETLVAALNFGESLKDLSRFEEAKALLRRTIPVARRVLREGDEVTLELRCCHAEALYKDGDATLDDLRGSLTTLEEIERTARRVLGGAHPTTTEIKEALQGARAALHARETPQSSLQR